MGKSDYPRLRAAAVDERMGFKKDDPNKSLLLDAIKISCAMRGINHKVNGGTEWVAMLEDIVRTCWQNIYPKALYVSNSFSSLIVVFIC